MLILIGNICISTYCSKGFVEPRVWQSAHSSLRHGITHASRFPHPSGESPPFEHKAWRRFYSGVVRYWRGWADQHQHLPLRHFEIHVETTFENSQRELWPATRQNCQGVGPAPAHLQANCLLRTLWAARVSLGTAQRNGSSHWSIIYNFSETFVRPQNNQNSKFGFDKPGKSRTSLQLTAVELHQIRVISK